MYTQIKNIENIWKKSNPLKAPKLDLIKMETIQIEWAALIGENKHVGNGHIYLNERYLPKEPQLLPQKNL